MDITSLKEIQEYIQQGKDIAYINKRTGNSYIHEASDCRPRILKTLLACGGHVCINLYNHNHETPLIISAHHDFLENTQLLLDNGADMELTDKEGNTPLLIAMKKGRFTTALLLLNSGANPFHQNHDKQGLLFFSIERSNLTLLEKALSLGLNFVSHYHYRGKQTAFHQAMQKKAYSIIPALLREKVNYLQLDDYGYTIFDIIASEDSVAALKVFLAIWDQIPLLEQNKVKHMRLEALF
jgi:ankyrin repeat protein